MARACARTFQPQYEPGLLSCREAIARADQEEGRETTEVEATLDWYVGRGPGTVRVRVWIVTYKEVQIIGGGRGQEGSSLPSR